MQSMGRTVTERFGRGAPLRQTARKIRLQGLVFPRSTSVGGHGLPSSRFERVLVGASGPLATLCVCARRKPKQKPEVPGVKWLKTLDNVDSGIGAARYRLALASQCETLSQDFLTRPREKKPKGPNHSEHRGTRRKTSSSLLCPFLG